MILKEQAAREDDTRATRAQLAEVTAQLSATRDAVESAQKSADGAARDLAASGVTVQERNASLEAEVKRLAQEQAKLHREMEAQVCARLVGHCGARGCCARLVGQ